MYMQCMVGALAIARTMAKPAGTAVSAPLRNMWPAPAAAAILATTAPIAITTCSEGHHQRRSSFSDSKTTHSHDNAPLAAGSIASFIYVPILRTPATDA